MKPIRNSAKAIIIQDEKILLTKNKDDFGFFYLFPGGGQDHGEELKDTVYRECLEEIGEKVMVSDLVYVREYIGKSHEFAEWDSDAHQVEFYFSCSLASNDSPCVNGTNPDKDQVGVEWIEIKKLHEIRLYPKALGKIIINNEIEIRYLGDVN
ncbi:NUDIX domain-containing protein [Paenibacillus eucommiae]|uniref:ADP-ribose pyrophosphatase YjhB (NUDIX family) n=1 Tax=Paenibacillus eucommiae TaxID=1355755 RepID=A0ABS4IZK2_9BACL|nr:NUDIX domain-containing protein [Paenibacillus eucommiae]MBP1993020.1 ADP-ribose pyrophosphatase YjhB (NUDIX family) [Paenibacillus eucommiae]